MEDVIEVVNDDDSVHTPTESKENGTSRQVATINPRSLSGINLFDDRQLVAAENFITKIMRSDKGGIKSVNDGLAILMRAQDLNLPFSSCIEHIHVINGKTGLDIHIIKALLSKAGVTWECIDDYTPLYEYTDGMNAYVDGEFPDYLVRCKSADEAKAKSEKEGSDDKIYVYPVKFYKDAVGNIYRDYQINPTKFAVALNKQQIAEITKQGKTPVIRIPSQPVNYMTRYKLKRIVNGLLVEAIGKFSYREAQQADMFEKDTYKKYPRVLISHRAFTLAARDIASDILFGVQETTEIKITNHVDLSDSDLIDEQCI